MGKRVYWKGKAMYFIHYSESYGLFQFKKSVSETSSLVQIHYFLIFCLSNSDELKKVQKNSSFEKELKLKFSEMAFCNLQNLSLEV